MNKPSPYHADPVIALAGNPNTGKSTVFNALTGLRQHTGNWPGKTVLHARGQYAYQGASYTVVDLPGTYSLMANSVDEEVARDFIYYQQPDATVVIADATCLERNLNLALQVMEITGKVILGVNLMDEARRKNYCVNVEELHRQLGVPVVAMAARQGEGLALLKETIADVVGGKTLPQPRLVRYEAHIEKAVAMLEPQLKDLYGDGINARWLSLRLLEGNKDLLLNARSGKLTAKMREAV